MHFVKEAQNPKDFYRFLRQPGKSTTLDTLIAISFDTGINNKVFKNLENTIGKLNSVDSYSSSKRDVKSAYLLGACIYSGKDSDGHNLPDDLKKYSKLTHSRLRLAESIIVETNRMQIDAPKKVKLTCI